MQIGSMAKILLKIWPQIPNQHLFNIKFSEIFLRWLNTVMVCKMRGDKGLDGQ